MNMLLCLGYVFGGVLGMMLSVYLVLSFICWLGDTFEQTTWRWKK